MNPATATLRPSGHRQTRLFRGWWIVVAAMVGQAFCLGTMLVYTFGVFAKPLAEEFKASRGSIALAVSLLDVVVTLTAARAGRLVDRYGARGVIVTSILGVAACLVGLSLLQPPLWHFHALYALSGLIGVASSPVTYSRVVANWFNRKLGLALGLASTGIGLGAFVMPSLAQFLIDQGGWRLAYMGLAGASLVIAAPVVGIFLRARPEDVGLLRDGASAPTAFAPRGPVAAGLSVPEALRTGTFWQLCSIFFCVAACAQGIIAHLAPLLTDHGVSGRSAAFATSLFGAATIAGRVGNGYLVDRFFAPRVVAVLFSGAALGAAMLWSGVTGNAAFLAAVLIGLALGAEADVMPFLVSRYFGMRSMAELFGWVFGSYTLGVATGRYLFAVGFDATGSYRAPLACAMVALVGAIVATLRLRRYGAVPAHP